jgi:hypothetical protein
MKDPEFIELLNLYLDHEISAGDAARLEAEVQGNPERRRIYQQYCRMQKACRVLAEDFQGGTVSVPELNIIDFKSVPQRSRAGGWYTIGTVVATAACVAIILVGRNREEPPTSGISPTIAVTAPAGDTSGIASGAAEAPVRALAHTVSMPLPMMQAPAPALRPEQLYLSRNARSDALVRAAAKEAAAHFAWMEQVQLSPLQPRAPLEALRFEAQPASFRTESRTYGSRQQPGDPQIEMTAFRFQR